ncbi:uncharacterized protein LOC115594400 isoform X2 [Sparus aurata]|uniref:uncharacterized protein LOC115577973 isoform X2 n=1 Tax=Sparus aurata TaxID=8175 RepID=UPI0011C17A1E|nr:uncharacterized protein LOC115577973 isoform X2 [Sparus aurata]XP_030294322.1 uncharacterized protein LOC115594400 isoform X2 [Sparus aurata]
MKTRRNSRGYMERYWEGRHLKLTDLKEEAKGLRNQYLLKENIPAWPRPEFHVSHLKHDTNRDGLRGIRDDSGFKRPHGDSLVWWSLAVTPDDITSAERRLLETTYPDRTEEQVQMQQSFLGKFATSPSFSELSRLGSYRFTFPLEELLEAYSQLCCSGAQPIMRVYETVLHKQEVVYVILVHSPANQELFSDRPLLTDDPNSVCSYKDGRFIWRPEAMCETHSYELVLRPDEKQMEAREVKPSRKEFYVWDHVAVALHVGRQVLKFDPA